MNKYLLKSGVILSTLCSFKLYANDMNWTRTDDAVKPIIGTYNNTSKPKIVHNPVYSVNVNGEEKTNFSCQDDRAIEFDLSMFEIKNGSVDNIYITWTTDFGLKSLSFLMKNHKEKNSNLDYLALKPLQWTYWSDKKVAFCYGTLVRLCHLNFEKGLKDLRLVYVDRNKKIEEKNREADNNLKNSNSDNNGTCEDINSGGGEITSNHDEGSGEEETRLADGNIKKVEVNGRHSVTLHPSENFSLKVDINNKGKAVYEDAQVYVYLTDDKGADLRGNNPLKKDKNEVSDLDPNERKTVHLSGLKAPSKPGTYYIYAWVKSQKDTGDSDYDNDYSNTSDKEEYAKIVVLPKPKPTPTPKPTPKPKADIVPIRILVTKRAVEGKETQIKYNLRNDGKARVEGRICDRIDVIKDGRGVKYFDNCYTERTFEPTHGRERYFKFVAPGAGNYQLSIKADFYNAVKESNEGNNRKVIDFRVSGKPKPDFTVVNPGTVGKFIEYKNPVIKYTVRNGGVGAYGQICELVRVYPYKKNNLLYARSFCHDASQTGEFKRTLYEFSPSQGTYEFKVEIDSSNKFAESNEGNNYAARKAFAVFSVPKPDIVVIKAWFSKTAFASQQTQAGYNVRNNSGVPLNGYMCDRVDIIKNGNSINHLDNCYSVHIQPYQKVEKFVNFTSPNSAGGGYKLSVKADFYNTIKEANDFNNQRVIPFAVFDKPKPDIVVIKAWFSKTAFASQQTQAGYNVRNNSGVPLNGYMCDRVDIIKNGNSINHLDNCYSVHIQPYQKVEKFVNFTSPNSAGGGYKLSVKADFYNTIKEANDFNNQRVIPFAVFAKPVASYRYYHSGTHAHLFTSNSHVPNGWSYADRSFKVFTTQIPGTVPIYAAWNWRDRTHRYSRSKNDLRHYFSEEPWVAFYAYPSWRPGTKPVREMWHPRLRVYIYSNGEYDANKLHDRFGFQKKSVVWYSPN